MIRAATLLVALVPAWAAAQDSGTSTQLGRLFFTPAERVALVGMRLAPGPEPLAGVQPTDTATPVAIAVPMLRLDGLVHRDAQPSIAFLNGRPVEDGGAILEYRVVAGTSSVTLLGADGQRVRLLVGQSLMREQGRIVDPLPPHSLSSPP
ncbi:hypothetical protein [Pseudomarimonas salicorniae]|uniref:General secretion pathway protein C n=1 Tax=Pseudomarimonas salicorniae TaxID=2933270 RepID=A0ABT0GF94_9GAMM|nr:hypothetical protein [Lysobacter sp. CAU 1642]MCK7592844.1 hypothetical protein [Lysobacter sp. CAU 1642]